ncbi:hypothetical protein BASA61_003187 [Batrachochytrium salamandrivorans]|nr:hypothetical protein BASA61_003187 [Batrachochytrium salamandrivorans]
MRLVKRYQEQLPVTSSSSGEKWDLDSILDYSLRVDASLRRKPQKNLMDACEQAVATLRRMEDQNGENDSESSLEYEQDCPLVNFQDTNRMNQSVIGLYQNQKHIAKPLSTPKSDDNIGADESLPLLSSTIESVDLPVNALEPKALQKKDDLRDARSLKRKQKTINNVDTKKSKVADAKWSTPTNRLSDLGGIEQIAKFACHLVILRYTGTWALTLPRGILLHGPPGCGKTMLAKAIAGEAGVPFICIAAPVVVSGMSGESEKKIREVFDEAKAMAPCILFIDEIDAITPKRETAQREMERRIVAQLLTCMDDLSPQNRSSSLDDTSPSKDDYRHVMIIGATNRPDSIDPALRRAGRFDREICMGVPDENAQAGMVAVNRIFESNTFDYGPEFDPMEITASDGDLAIVEVTKGVEKLASSDLKMSRFLMSHPEPLKQEELDHLSITFLDFLEALKKVQPSSKREGFATVPDVSWDDIGSLKSVRDELRMAVVEPILHPEYFEGVGITSSMGVLLYGPPGCGKTLLAKAVANESRCNFISVKGPELLNKYVGESERAVRTVFSRAQASSPCVIFFDELDALCPSRSNEAESQSASRLVNTLLTEMDGMQGRKQVFVIAATNRPDMIDPAMMRPGRLDKTLYVDLPNKSERFEILKTLTRKTPLSSSLDLHMISEDPRCEGLSGADLASLVREAAVSALRSRFYTNGVFLTPAARSSVDAKVIVDLEHFSIAFSKVPPSVHKKDLKRYELLKVKFSTAELASHQSR